MFLGVTNLINYYSEFRYWCKCQCGGYDCLGPPDLFLHPWNIWSILPHAQKKKMKSSLDLLILHNKITFKESAPAHIHGQLISQEHGGMENDTFLQLVMIHAIRHFNICFDSPPPPPLKKKFNNFIDLSVTLLKIYYYLSGQNLQVMIRWGMLPHLLSCLRFLNPV